VVIYAVLLFLMLFGVPIPPKKGHIWFPDHSPEVMELSGVSCLLANSDYGSYHASSSADGTFIFSDIWNGTYTLTVSKPDMS